jgi:hypothetical protein
MNIPKKYKHELKNCKIYIIRINNGDMHPAQPCDKCSKLLNKFRISKVYTI